MFTFFSKSNLRKLIPMVVPMVVLFASICAGPKIAHGQSTAAFESRIVETLSLAKQFHQRAESLPKQPFKADRKKQLYVSMASKLSPPREFDHLPFPKSSTESWVKGAEKVSKGLKPNVNYQVVKGDEDAVICVNQQIAESLYHNVRLIAWYRDQLDELDDKSKETESAPPIEKSGSAELGNLIDEYFDCLSDGLPRLKVTKRGRMNMARQQKITISNHEIWNILSIINRYFFYKAQVVGDTSENMQADFLLVESMTKTAAIYGAEPPKSGLADIDVELSEEGPGWHRAGYRALESWNQAIKRPESFEKQLVTVAIPAKKKPPAKAKPKAPGFPTDVEDIKEIGGQMFIKRKGKWQPWTMK